MNQPQTKEQVHCEMCGLARTSVPSIQTSGLCPFCGSQRLRKQPLNSSHLPPDLIVPFRVNMQHASQAAAEAMPAFLKRRSISEKNINRVLRVPFYAPYWYFDIALDPDGSGPQKPGHRIEQRLAVGVSLMKHLLAPLEIQSQTPRPYGPAYLENVPMVVPDVPYHAAVKEMLMGVQTSLADENLPPTRTSGMIGELGMVTKLLLMPVWLVVLIEVQRLHHMLVHGVSGAVYQPRPRQ